MIKINPSYNDYFPKGRYFRYYYITKGISLIFNIHTGEYEGIDIKYLPKNTEYPDTLASITIDNLLRKGILDLTD